MTGARNSPRPWLSRASSWAWPLLSMASVAWSLWLLQVKLEAEVSTDPVVKAMLDEGAFWNDMKVISQAIGDSLAQIPMHNYMLAGLATLAAYVALAWYDRIALIHLGRLKGISWLYVGACSFVAYALAHNIGASVISGGMVRLRAYTVKGLAKAEVALLIAMCTFTFAYGTLLLLGVVLLFEPEIVAPLESLFPSLGVPEALVRAAGATMLLACAMYVLGSFLGLKPLNIGAFKFAYPSLKVVGRQIVAAPLELIAAAAIIYFALPEAGNPGFFIVLGAFLISFSAGLISQVPGGIGVMEAVFLAVMPDVPATALVAALLVWRLLYLLIPLVLSAPIILAFEHSLLWGDRRTRS